MLKTALLIAAVSVATAAAAIEPPVAPSRTPSARSVTVYLGKVPVIGTVVEHGLGIREYHFSGVTKKTELKKAVETLSPGCDSYAEGQKKVDEIKVVVYCEKKK